MFGACYWFALGGFMRSCTARLTFGLALAASVWGCKSPAKDQPEASTSALARSPSAGVAPRAPVPPGTIQLPEGPQLAIQAGQGVGPIRIGATVATIERLMEAPCEVKTESVCRYIRRA